MMHCLDFLTFVDEEEEEILEDLLSENNSESEMEEVPDNMSIGTLTCTCGNFFRFRGEICYKEEEIAAFL